MGIKNSFAFVLNKENVSESDRIYTFYIEDLGKIRLLAKGSQKIRAKLSGHLEIPSYVWIKFILSHQNKLISALEIDPFLEIKENFFSLLVSFEILRFLNNFTIENQPDLKIWNLLMEIFSYLKENANKNKQISFILLLYFKAQVLKIYGWAPYLKDCLVCGFKEANYFSIYQKGIVCKKHKDYKALFLTRKEKDIFLSFFEKKLSQIFRQFQLEDIIKFYKKIYPIFQEFTFCLESDIIY